MSDKKTTAVQWLIVQMQTFEFLHLDRNKILVKALEMEKQQIIDAHCNGQDIEDTSGVSDAKEYYNQTFKP